MKRAFGPSCSKKSRSAPKKKKEEEEEEEEDLKPAAVSQAAAEVIDLSHFEDEDEDELSSEVGRRLQNAQKTFERYNMETLEAMWRKAEECLGMGTTEEMERSEKSGIRHANRAMDPSDSKGQVKVQYGRLCFEATNALFEILLLDPKRDIFVNIGHGIGNTVYQAAYLKQCTARRIEVCGQRYNISVDFQKELYNLRTYDKFRVGYVQLLHGRLEDPDVKVVRFLTNPFPEGGKRIKAFFNNYKGSLLKDQHCHKMTKRVSIWMPMSPGFLQPCLQVPCL